MEGDPEVGAAVRHLLEAERDYITPVLKSRADGPLGSLFAQVRRVVEDTVRQAPFTPGSCEHKHNYLLYVD